MTTKPTFHRRTVLAAAAASAALPMAAWAQQPPIKIGSTLALTGPLSSTAQVHKLVGEIYVEDLNRRGGHAAARPAP